MNVHELPVQSTLDYGTFWGVTLAYLRVKMSKEMIGRSGYDIIGMRNYFGILSESSISHLFSTV